MNIEAFIKWEKDIIREERERLNKLIEKDNTIETAKNNDSTNALKKPEESPVGPSNGTFSLSTNYPPERATIDMETQDFRKLSKPAKEVVNQQTALSTNKIVLTKENKLPNAAKGMPVKSREAKAKDDKDQWVTDDFYSYFPGYNDELQKRQRYLRERQQENQQNLLKHQLAHPPLPRYALHKSKQFQEIDQTVNTARSSATTTTSNTTNSGTTMSHPTKKTDLEIIVNNPGYVPPKQNPSRPNTTRCKLLQDLRHTELSQIVDVDRDVESNHHAAELDLARKKNYQRELMEQIDEKRRSVEALREKERHQEEILTRRLQEQLKTIHLEEQFEKEKMRADKVRFDSEQSRLMRQQLLAKLENDSRLMNANAINKCENNKMRGQDGLSDKPDNVSGTATTVDAVAAATCNGDSGCNKVYKYFSNSASHEYRRGRPLPKDLELDLGMQSAKNDEELECFHLSDKVCPMCDAPLKSYETCCIRCQKKLSRRMKKSIDGNIDNDAKCLEDNAMDTGSSIVEGNFSMVCAKCERLYGFCATCLSQKEVCRACHRRRNVCLNCRRTLCTRCLDEIATGRDTEKSHVNECAEGPKQSANKTDAESLRSFEVLEVNYGALPERDNDAAIDYVSPRRDVINNQSGSMESPTRKPYSMSIEKNSIFHPEYHVSAFEQLDTSTGDDQFTIERVRRENDKRLSRYLKNYGDLAINPRSRSRSECGNDRSTQTTPNTARRRDVVLHEEHNLSMPLLREMPKMTRVESDRMLQRKPTFTISNRIQQLKRRWEVPAVQKFTISTTSPKVLTQIGAMRKQLQADEFIGDD